MKKLSTLHYSIIGLALLTAVFFAGRGSGTSHEAIPQAAASFAPEAQQLAIQLKADIARFGSGAQLINQGEDLIKQGRDAQMKASAAAKGRDNILCADHKARFDRTTQQLVADEDCPLL